MIDSRGMRPSIGLQRGGQACEILRIERVRLGAVVRPRGIDDAGRIARGVHADGEGDPVAAGRFEDDERGIRWDAGRRKLALHGRESFRSLRMGGWRARRGTGEIQAAVKMAAAMSMPTNNW